MRYCFLAIWIGRVLISGSPFNDEICPACWSCRIHRLHLSRGVRTPNECPVYHSKQFDGDVPVMRELWRIRSTLLLLLLPGPLWPGVVAPDRVPFMDQIELNCVRMLNCIVWNRTVYMYKIHLALNDLWWLIWHQTKSNQRKPNNEMARS